MNRVIPIRGLAHRLARRIAGLRDRQANDDADGWIDSETDAALSLAERNLVALATAADLAAANHAIDSGQLFLPLESVREVAS